MLKEWGARKPFRVNPMEEIAIPLAKEELPKGSLWFGTGAKKFPG